MAKTLYSVTNDNKYLDMMIKIYETSKYELDKRVCVVGFQSLAKMPKVYEKLIEIYINDEDSISRNTAIRGVLWADGYLKIPGYRLIRASYDEKECTEINKEKELIQEFKNENIEERKRIINSYLNGEFTLFHGFYCKIKDKLSSDKEEYTLIPFSGSTQELQDDPIFTEYHYWRGVAEKRNCNICGKIFFAANVDDGCPYCQNYNWKA